MALADNASVAATKFASLSIPRQIGVLFGLAASIAIGVAVVLWSRDPSYVPLYSQINAQDSSEILTILERNGIDFKIDKNNGLLMVPADELQSARLKLAAQGLPRDTAIGHDLLGSGGGVFNTSQFMENARYKQALEAELARTISKFNNIKSARVHLAIPRESAFVRDSQEPSASVFIDVYSGFEIKKHTIAAIVNLVASSIPNLSAGRVTVVDQDGQLLNEGSGYNLFSETERFLDYRQNLEHQYAQKIQDILTPILGYGRVRAKVSADIDFTSYEQTQELFNPELSALRSEQTMQESRNASNEASGVPGTLSNTPQPNGSLGQKNNPQQKSTPNNSPQQTSSDQMQAKDVRMQTTKNFELDKTISHTKNQPGTIKRLSVAVLVDNRPVMNDKTKKLEKKPLTKEEIEQIKLLVSDAIGLNVKRGDSLNVINSSFVKPDPIEAIPEEHFWQKDSFWSVIKQIGGALFILAILFGVLRPMLKTLASNKDMDQASNNQDSGDFTLDGKISFKDVQDYETQLSLLRQVVDKEPKRVAQVVKSWVDRG
ncbi:flagellar basal-body MS-ring/collar protein FliF [Legionella sp. PATHC032]|uniref:flagellar basal-body MS-ring/collar protein FliF n=1 Tax=Legionella sp. PATHC032 TaxID=2992039 RepID=UPI001B029903|nr:flagellar basal-body MS-ring/collar protein FliF [Legionella sp. PATHC032]MCW8421634.1 flagellar basal-body MS-ring/collar protein FliF [Legionella sp. PATHC032]HAZ7571841.1 flagellar basal body M-ring protein FliF [Legionella pneumophila]HBA1633781.1 flagellar basal body M-ring protein FliF [Legionella pneumophila]